MNCNSASSICEAPGIAADLERIQSALLGAKEVVALHGSAPLDVEYKSAGKGNPVTRLDRELNNFLRRALLRGGEGWLSEESADDLARLSKSRVWIVDPLDGTKELVSGIPEWCVSVALSVDGEVAAGGVMNPIKGEIFLGAAGLGLTCNGERVQSLAAPNPGQAVVLASRSELARGEWKRWANWPFRIRPMGSIAYKLALVAGGFANATWTFVPKHEWDIAAGVALIRASGGIVLSLDGAPLTFNRPVPIISGLLACSSASSGILNRVVQTCSTGDSVYTGRMP